MFRGLAAKTPSMLAVLKVSTATRQEKRSTSNHRRRKSVVHDHQRKGTRNDRTPEFISRVAHWIKNPSGRDI